MIYSHDQRRLHIPALISILLILFINSNPVLSQSESFQSVSEAAAKAMSQNRIPEAIQLYRKSVEFNYKWEEGWWYLGVLLYETDQYSEGRKAFQVVTHLNPQMSPAWLMLGLCQFGQKDYYPALTNISRAISIGLG